MCEPLRLIRSTVQCSRERRITLNFTETDFRIHTFAFFCRIMKLGDQVILQMGKLRLKGRCREAEPGNNQASFRTSSLTLKLTPIFIQDST